MRVLLTIDMQNWMFRTASRAAQLPVLCPALTKLQQEFLDAGLPIINIRTEHKADGSTWSRRMRLANHACLIENSEDAAPVAGFTPVGITLIKTANDSFLNTPLETLLQALKATQIVLSGVFMDGCIALTAAGAAQRGYDICLTQEAIGWIDQERAGQIRLWLADMYGIED